MGACLSQKLKPRGGPIPLRGALSTIECNILSLALKIRIGNKTGEITRKLNSICRSRHSPLGLLSDLVSRLGSIVCGASKEDGEEQGKSYLN